MRHKKSEHKKAGVRHKKSIGRHNVPYGIISHLKSERADHWNGRTGYIKWIER